MSDTLKPFATIVDFITGRAVPNVGAEENRQQLERYLVERKGYGREDIEVEVPIEMDIAGERYRSVVDLVAGAGGRRMVAFRCAAGSLGSCEREILAVLGLILGGDAIRARSGRPPAGWSATRSPGPSRRTAGTPSCSTR